MPSIHKRDGRPYWYAAFYNGDGLRSLKSTGTNDKKEAMRRCLEWAEASKTGREGRLTQERARKVLADIFARSNKEMLPTSTVREYLESWLSKKELEVEESSLVQYRTARNTLLDHLGAKANRSIETITLRDVSALRDTLARRMAAASVNKTLKILGGVWRQARKDGLIDDDIFSKISPVKGLQGKRRPFTGEELKLILGVSDNEWRGMILFGYYVGARLSDIASLTWANVDFANKELHFTAQKTKRPMHVPLAGVLVQYLMALPSSDDPHAPLFPSSYEGNRSGTLSNRFYNIMVSAGLVPKRSHEKAKGGRDSRRVLNELSFHCLRHSAASALRNNGVTDVVAMTLLGHESAAIARNYTKIDRSSLRAAVDKLPDLTK
ncbi:MAG: tyrosine-type recombinase/integrase [bacterium]